jgi:transposase
MAWAWERRNVAQVVELRWGAGSMPASRRISHTVDAAILTPKHEQFAVNSPISPRDVLPGQAQHQHARRSDRGPPSITLRTGDTCVSGARRQSAGQPTATTLARTSTAATTHCCDTVGLLLVVAVTGAHVQDRDGARGLITALRMCVPGVTLVWADSGDQGKLVDWSAALGITIKIVRKLADQIGFVVLHRKWVVERTFSWINRCRRAVRDREWLPEHHAAMVQWAMAIIMTRRLARHHATGRPPASLTQAA